jgi:uncharacterized membrane protein
VTGTFSANPVTPPADGSVVSRLTLRVSSSAPIGTYTLTVSGSSDTFTRKVSFNLMVKSS